MRFFVAEPDLNHAGFILHQLAHRLAAETPHARKFPDPVMFLERAGYR
jgi:hypothetical protein